jgi:hypothetical protein
MCDLDGAQVMAGGAAMSSVNKKVYKTFITKIRLRVRMPNPHYLMSQ